MPTVITVSASTYMHALRTLGDAFVRGSAHVYEIGLHTVGESPTLHTCRACDAPVRTAWDGGYECTRGCDT